MPSTIIQPAVTRSESVRHHISNHSWKRGIENFFTSKVPFSYTTGFEFAEKIITLLDSFYQSNPKKQLRLIELGAGTGMLACRIIDLLKQRNHPLLHVLEFIVTDFSESMINQAQSACHKETYSPYITFRQFNIFTDSLDSLPQADIVLMTYLLDSLNARHIDYNPENTYEWFIQSSLSKDAMILNATQFPPHPLTGDALVSFIKEAAQGDHINAYATINDCIQESWKRIPLEKAHLSSESESDLNQFLAWLSPKDRVLFNYSYDISKFLDRLLSSLSKQSMVIIYDFGTASLQQAIPQKKQLIARYNVCDFYSVFFPFLHYKAHCHDFSYLQTCFENGISQCCVLHKNGSDSSLSSTFKNTFKQPGGEHSFKITALIKRYRKRKIKKLTLYDYIQSKLKSLSDAESLNYSLRLNAAIELFQDGDSDHALKMVDELINTYGYMALSSYHLKSEILNKKKAYDEVAQLTASILEIYPYYLGLHYQRCFALGYLERHSEFIQSIHLFLRYSDHFIPWRFFIALLISYFAINQSQNAKELITWLFKIDKQHPTFVPQHIIKDTKELIDKLTDTD